MMHCTIAWHVLVVFDQKGWISFVYELGREPVMLVDSEFKNHLFSLDG